MEDSRHLCVLQGKPTRRDDVDAPELKACRHRGRPHEGGEFAEGEHT